MNKLYFKVVIMMLYMMIPMISFTLAANADYVGISEGDEYIWSFTFDEDVIDEVEEDLGGTFNTDMKGLKMEVKEIGEKDEDYSGDDYVEIEIDQYYTERSIDEDDWSDESTGNYYLYDYDKEIYASRIMNGAILIPTNIDWYDLKEYMIKEFKDNDYIKEAEVEVFWNSGLRITLDYEDNDLETLEYISTYNIKGVSALYKFNYGGENCFTVSLRGIDGFLTFPTIILFTIIIIAVIGIIITIIVKSSNSGNDSYGMTKNMRKARKKYDY